ncbi:MAG TPA: hypothetical protein VGP94_02580 [Tepidisphaeraceae bacterium]|jgi:hypothetical protein|nr:hypothetical protein [Tepidisphaeraceae bacterium]
MTEREFWDKLDVRVRREFAGLKQNPLCGISCDGFDPHTFWPHEAGAQIVGQMWFLGIGGEWNFELIVRRRIEAWKEVKWDELLPAEDVTGWMWVDFEKKVLKIDPGAAYPDGGHRLNLSRSTGRGNRATGKMPVPR